MSRCFSLAKLHAVEFNHAYINWKFIMYITKKNVQIIINNTADDIYNVDDNIYSRLRGAL